MAHGKPQPWAVLFYIFLYKRVQSANVQDNQSVHRVIVQYKHHIQHHRQNRDGPFAEHFHFGKRDLQNPNRQRRFQRTFVSATIAIVKQPANAGSAIVAMGTMPVISISTTESAETTPHSATFAALERMKTPP